MEIQKSNITMIDTSRISVICDDITTLNVDAIVNAANSTLLGGGGVDGAIHKAAGPELLAECKALHGCKTGEAKLTKGYLLPASFVIHTVGPVWYGGVNNEPEKLQSCYKNSLMIAKNNKFKTIAFPAISAGVYRYPAKAAAEIAVSTTVNFFEKNDLPNQVIFCTYSTEMYKIYKNTLNNLLKQ